MPRNGSGVYSPPAGNPVTTGTTIDSTVHNNTIDDIGDEITASLAKDGQTVPTADLPMGGFKHTGAAAATATGEYVRYDEALRQGVHTIPINALSMLSRTTNGAADGVSETTTNKVMIVSKDFDATTQEFVQFYVPMPKSWNEGTVTARFHWTATTGTATQGVVWGIQGLARSDDDGLDTAFGTAVEVTDAYIVSQDVHISAATAAITIGGTPAEQDFVIFQVYRDPADAADTKTGDAKLLAVEIFITYSAGNDA